MRREIGSLDYLSLIRELHKPPPSLRARKIRVAVLADCAVQQLSELIRKLGTRDGCSIEIYEGDYDAIDLEILNSQSGLYAFEPQYVIALMTAEKLKARLYDSADRAHFAEETVARIEQLWRAFGAQSNATIIQSTFVLPTERAFGNFELLVAESVGSIMAEINYQLAKRAKGAKNVLINDVDFLAASLGRSRWSDPRLWNMAKTPCKLEYLPRLAQSMLDTIFAAAGLFTKCVVLDLDNTLWGGVIGDDGLEGIQLGGFDEGEAFVSLQKFIRELKRRGIILAVVSKNELESALMPFQQHPNMILKEEDISAFVANWDNKADNIRAVQKTLNISFDSIVFLDDNPFERNIVREYLPQIIVPELPDDPSLYLETIAELNLFETGSFSEADSQRANQYREEVQRESTKVQFNNVQDYLVSLNMQIKLERFNAFNIPRIAQLIQRSNQFNLTTRRYGEAACEALMFEAGVMPFTLKLADKFGDYGLISVIVLKELEEEIEVDEYLMSCRVLQRGVEDVAMNNIFSYARQSKKKRVIGKFIPTTKNAMVKDFFARFGFRKVSEDEEGAVNWEMPVDEYQERPAFMTIQSEL